MQSRTSFRTASLLVRTAKKTFVKSCVRLFSKTSSFDKYKFGDDWPSLDDLVVFTPELGVDWNLTQLCVGGV